MSKKRKKTSFKYYEGLTKDGTGNWRILGNYKTLDEAREAGAIKCKPRFNRG